MRLEYPYMKIYTIIGQTYSNSVNILPKRATTALDDSVLNFLMSLVTESHITCFPGFLFSVNKCFILISRSNTTLQPNTQMAPPKASPRYHTIILYSKQLQTTRLALDSPLFSYSAPLQTLTIITLSKY